LESNIDLWVEMGVTRRDTLSAAGQSVEEIDELELASKETLNRARTALELSRQEIQSIPAAGSDVVYSILVDDKVQAIDDRRHWLRDVLCPLVATWPEAIDFVCFESDLCHMKDEMLEGIELKHRPSLKKEIERYVRKHGEIACSHDISLWHLFRLNIIGHNRPDAPKIYPLRSAIDRKLSMSRFRSKIAVSIVRNEDLTAEKRAADEILAHISGLDRSSILERLRVRGY
jgi:hypothetical protein